MAKPTILMIGNYLSQPRHNRNVWNDLAERLAGDGWGILVTSRQENQALRLLDMLFTILVKRKQYALAQIDVFSGKAFIYAELGSCLLRLLKKPVLLTLHGGGLPEFARRHPRRAAALLHCANAVITPSPFIKERLQTFRQDIQVIPNPIDISKAIFRPRAKLAPRLIWVRAFHDVYNPMLAVRVLRLLKDDFPDVHLSMIGPDKGDGSLQDCQLLARSLGVDTNLQITAGIPHAQIAGNMDSADIFLNTTNYDAAPRSVLEAMACGLCVVSTNVGGMGWLVENGQDGLLVSPGNPKAMANAVSRLLNDSALASHLSSNARQKAENLDWSRILPQWEAVITTALKENLNG